MKAPFGDLFGFGAWPDFGAERNIEAGVCITRLKCKRAFQKRAFSAAEKCVRLLAISFGAPAVNSAAAADSQMMDSCDYHNAIVVCSYWPSRGGNIGQ